MPLYYHWGSAQYYWSNHDWLLLKTPMGVFGLVIPPERWCDHRQHVSTTMDFCRINPTCCGLISKYSSLYSDFAYIWRCLLDRYGHGQRRDVNKCVIFVAIVQPHGHNHLLYTSGILWIYGEALIDQRCSQGSSGRCYQYCLTLTSAWMSNYIHYEVWGENNCASWWKQEQFIGTEQ